MDPRYSRYQALNAAYKKPRLVWYPKDSTRLTVQVSAIIAVLLATLISLIPQPLPGISWIFIYAIVMAYTQGRRQAGFNESTPYPPVTVFGEKGLHLQPRIKVGSKHWPLIFTLMSMLLIGLTSAAAVTAITWEITHLGKHWHLSTKAKHNLAFYGGIHLWHFQIGPLHLWQWATIAGVTAITAATIIAVFYIWVDQRVPWKADQLEKTLWEQRWQAALKGANPPAFQGKLELPESAPTHIKAVFQIDAGSDFSVYANSASKLASTMGPDMVLIEPMPMVGPDGTLIPGTTQMLGFTVTYALTSLGDRPWCRPDLDDQTLAFGARWGFQRAFRELKLGLPGWADMRVLRRATQHPEDLLIETLWRLPHGVPITQFVARTQAIQEKMEMRWLRIGNRPKGPDWQSELVSVCYTDNPDILSNLRPSDSEFLHGIEWEHAFRAVNLVGNDGVMPAYRGSENTEQGLRAHSFGAAPDLPWEKVQMARSALVPTLRYHYVQLEQTDEAGGFRIICGDADPLDRSYLFRDWAFVTMGVPTEKPQMDFYVGIGADGAPVKFAFDDESPHLIVAGASLSLDTVIVKADGTETTMGNIKQGDRILDDKSKPCTVTQLYAIYNPERCYRLTFDDGTTIEASDTHKWETETATQRGRAKRHLAAITARSLPVQEQLAAIERALQRCPDRHWDDNEQRQPDRLYDVQGHWIGVVPSELSGGSQPVYDWQGVSMVRSGALATEVGYENTLRRLAKLIKATQHTVTVKGRSRPGRMRTLALHPRNELLRQLQDSIPTLIPNTISVASQSHAVTTQDIYETLWTTGSRHTPNHAIRLAPPIEWEQTSDELPVDPYTLGVWLSPQNDWQTPPIAEQPIESYTLGAWLGDGHTYTGAIGCADPEIFDEIKAHYELTSTYRPHRIRELDPNYRVAYFRGLAQALRKAGLLTNKHIPETYLRAPLARRLALLQGLMDTDGSCDAKQGTCEFSTSIPVVAEGMRRLLWSMGIKHGMNTRQPKWPGSKLSYRIRFTTDQPVFRLQRKLAVMPPTGTLRTTQNYRYIMSCEPIPVKPMRCIQVDSPTHLFAAGRAAIILYNSGMGKCLTLGTPILKVDGTSTTMRDIQAGDMIFDETGQPCRVTRLYDIQTQQSYEIELDEGEIIRASGNHRWAVWDAATRAELYAQDEQDWSANPGRLGPRLYTTEQLMGVMGQDVPAIRVAPALPGVHNPGLPVDPYVLGVWLGAGQQGQSNIARSDGDRAVLDEVSMLYPERTDDTAMGVGAGQYQTDYRGLGRDLAAAGVLQRKNIPPVYFSASVKQRRALLQGLMDTCGLVVRNPVSAVVGMGLRGPVCTWRHQDAVLVRDVYRLVRTLGLKASTPVPLPAVEGQVRGYLMVVFVAEASDAPFRVHPDSKNVPDVLPGNAHQWHYIKAVRRAGQMAMRCVDVDSPNHLFLCGDDLVTTHNSAFLHSMVLQLANKNTPEQWELRIAEPKNELQRYKALPHVTRFVDMRTPSPNIFGPVADMLEELKDEMERRYGIFERLPGKPSKLEQALENPALTERLPYITCLIEECADYFVEPKRKEQKEDYARLMEPLEWLSRKARGAGIYLVVCTQRPTKNNLPTQVKANSRKIGFGTSTGLDSMIIIDQPGLELIHTKGRGLVSAFKGYRGFRGFFLDDGAGGRNDLQRYLSPLCVLSPDRMLGATVDTSWQWPPANLVAVAPAGDV